MNQKKLGNEIERKFLIKKMPDLSNLKSVVCERYYIYRDEVIELRVQKIGNKYEIERKEIINKLKAIKTKLAIFKHEFGKLKRLCSATIVRESYNISSDPDVSIKIYHGKYEGLRKIEVEFSSEEEASFFQIPDWYGEEITDSLVSRDSKLLDLNDEEFKMILEEKNNH
ncbi:MAG TPA: hypothetical protein VMW41_01855 [Candidatus Bathyarchaeia archaeon]|nr:hypothetical protein [Candidatus Bathyarchaeia archaeon]